MSNMCLTMYTKEGKHLLHLENINKKHKIASYGRLRKEDTET